MDAGDFPITNPVASKKTMTRPKLCYADHFCVFHYRNSRNSFKRLLLLLFILPGFMSYAQQTLNAGFEYIGHNNKPVSWAVEKDDYYNVFIDSADYFEGNKSLHIRPTPLCSPLSSQVYFKTIDLSRFPGYRTIEVRYKMKINRGDSDCLNAYAAQFTCPAPAGSFKAFNVRVDTIAWGGRFQPGKWITYTMSATPVAFDSCTEFYFGFVVKGLVDMNVDALELTVNGKPVKDIPPVLKPLPGKKEIAWLTTQVRPFKSSDDATYLQDLNFLDKSIGDAEVVALGEATHGTSEFSTLQNRIIKYLVEQKGFEVIALEEEMLSTHQIIEPPQLERRTAEVIKDYFFLVHRTEEMAALVDYVKERNRLPGNKIYLEGIDNQFPNVELDELSKRLPAIDSVLANIIKGFDGPAWFASRYSRTFADSVYAMSIQLQAAFEERKQFVARKLQDTAQFLRLQKTVGLLKDVLYFTVVDRRNQRVLSSCRDSLMAQNLLWLRRFYPGKKIILLCHNGHIKKEVRHSPYSRSVSYTGSYLAASLGEKYKAYGLTTAEGSGSFFDARGKRTVRALEPPTRDCYEYYLSGMKMPLLFWELPKDSATITKYKLLLQDLRLRSQGYGFGYNQFSEGSLPAMFDGVFFIRKSTASKALQ